MLVERLVAAGATPVTVVTTDLFYDGRAGSTRAGSATGAAAVEMETATLLRLAELRGVEAAARARGDATCRGPDGSRRAEPEELEAIGLRVGRAGYEALRTR